MKFFSIFNYCRWLNISPFKCLEKTIFLNAVIEKAEDWIVFPWHDSSTLCILQTILTGAAVDGKPSQIPAFYLWPLPWGQGHTKCCPVPSTSHHICTCKVWSCFVQRLSLQENTLYDLDLGVKVTYNVAQYSTHHVIYAPAKFEVAKSNRLGDKAFTRKYIIWPLPWGQGHPNHPTVYHVIYASTKFVVDTSNS